MKKMLISAVSVAMLSVMALSGCTGTEKAIEPSDKQDPQAAKNVNPAGMFPIVKEKVTMKVLVVANALVEDFATNTFTKQLEEKTNIHLEWEVVPSKSAQEKLNLVLASADYPDIIMGFGVTPTQQMIFGEQGVFLPLNQMIDTYSVDFKKALEKFPLVKESITDTRGNIYALPTVNDCFQCSMSQKMYIYKPWLDKLGLKMPTTTDEFYEVLKAFKEKDPNGNGKADEIPLAGAPAPSGSDLALFMMNAFTPYNKSGLILNNGKIEAAFTKPEWKDGLQYLQKLYAEKLISPQSFTQDTNQLKQMAENPDIAVLGAASANNVSVITQISGKSGRWLEYVTVPPLKGPKGVQVAALNPFNAGVGQFIITKANKNPEAAFRLADYLYSEEATFPSVNGVEGKQWKKASATDIGLDGKPAKWVELIPFGQVQNDFWAQSGVFFFDDTIRLSKAADPKTPNLAYILYKETKEKYDPYKQKVDTVVPPLYLTTEQASEMADLSKTITDYGNQMFVRFVTGDVNLEKGWADYLKQLDSMKINRYLQINQEAYDTKYKKK
jgi:putative aldouronate transport system substrate-binding protein